jgi:hypothetical protein
VKRRIIVAIAAAVLSLGVAAAPAAYADPDFGPGNSSKGPNDRGGEVSSSGPDDDGAGLQVRVGALKHAPARSDAGAGTHLLPSRASRQTPHSG